MRRKGLDLAVDLALRVDVKLAGVLHRAVCAVAETVWAVFLRVDGRKHVLGVAAADTRREPRSEHAVYINYPNMNKSQLYRIPSLFSRTGWR